MASRISVFLAELKRRKVFRAAVAYAVAGVGIIEGAGLVQPTFGFPQIVTDFLVFLVALGFPVALVVSWFIEVTPEGIRRTPDPTPEELAAFAPGRWGTGGWVLVTVGTLVIAAAGYFAFLRAAAPHFPPDRVAVFPFENEAGDAVLEACSRNADQLKENCLGMVSDLGEGQGNGSGVNSGNHAAPRPATH